MHTDVVRLDWHARRRVVVAYCLGMAAYALVIVALYPQFRHSTTLDDITRNAPTLSALFGAVGSLTSPSGWLAANVYENFFPLLILLLTIGYGASAVAGMDADGSLALVATLPFSRTRIVAEKAAALLLQAAALSLVVGAVVLAGQAFHINLPALHVIEATVAVLLLGADFGLLALAAGAATGRRGIAMGLATAAAAASYLISSLAPVVAWLRPGRYLSLFYWAVGNNQLTNGLSLLDAVVLAAAAVAATTAAVLLFGHLDLH